MELKPWLKKNKMSLLDLSKQIDASYSYLTKLSAGTRRCSINLAMMIEEFTKGEVTKEDLLFEQEPFDELAFQQWCYGTPHPQTPVGHCFRWRDSHPELKPIDHMAVGEGFSYMLEEYAKAQEPVEEE